jgi:hypothetical protein
MLQVVGLQAITVCPCINLCHTSRSLTTFVHLTHTILNISLVHFVSLLPQHRLPTAPDLLPSRRGMRLLDLRSRVLSRRSDLLVRIRMKPAVRMRLKLAGTVGVHQASIIVIGIGNVVEGTVANTQGHHHRHRTIHHALLPFLIEGIVLGLHLLRRILHVRTGKPSNLVDHQIKHIHRLIMNTRLGVTIQDTTQGMGVTARLRACGLLITAFLDQLLPMSKTWRVLVQRLRLKPRNAEDVLLKIERAKGLLQVKRLLRRESGRSARRPRSQQRMSKLVERFQSHSLVKEGLLI